MIILDNSTVNRLLDSGTKIPKTLRIFLAEDAYEEAVFTFKLRGVIIPANFINLGTSELLDSASYYKQYEVMLNKHRGYSFYGSSGFGDISLLATLAAILTAQGGQTQIPGTEEHYDVFTDDHGLTDRLGKEFSDNANVTLRTFGGLGALLSHY